MIHDGGCVKKSLTQQLYHVCDTATHFKVSFRGEQYKSHSDPILQGRNPYRWSFIMSGSISVTTVFMADQFRNIGSQLFGLLSHSQLKNGTLLNMVVCDQFRGKENIFVCWAITMKCTVHNNTYLI